MPAGFDLLETALGLEDARASFLTNSENLSAPVAREASARLVVFAATDPKAAASLRPELKAANATSSAVLMGSLEAESFRMRGGEGV